MLKTRSHVVPSLNKVANNYSSFRLFGTNINVDGSGAIPEIINMGPEMKEWRHDFHENPELAFQEVRTSKIIAERLESWGIEVTRDIAKTGVVGTLKGKHKVDDDDDDKIKKRSIGLRADMDALPMQEENNFSHCSKIPGRMHGCGHDGHTTMLLGAANYLAQTRNF